MRITTRARRSPTSKPLAAGRRPQSSSISATRARAALVSTTTGIRPRNRRRRRRRLRRRRRRLQRRRRRLRFAARATAPRSESPAPPRSLRNVGETLYTRLAIIFCPRCRAARPRTAGHGEAFGLSRRAMVRVGLSVLRHGLACRTRMRQTLLLRREEGGGGRTHGRKDEAGCVPSRRAGEPASSLCRGSGDVASEGRSTPPVVIRLFGNNFRSALFTYRIMMMMN